MRDHSASGSDAFRAPSASRTVIPDDWEDLLAPTPPKAAPAPIAAPVPPATGGMLIPDDDIFGIEPLAPPPAPEPEMEPEVEPPADLPPEPVAPPVAEVEPVAPSAEARSP